MHFEILIFHLIERKTTENENVPKIENSLNLTINSLKESETFKLRLSYVLQ